MCYPCSHYVAHYLLCVTHVHSMLLTACFAHVCSTLLNACNLLLMFATGLKPGRVNQVIRVNWVTFCPGQPGLTRFIKYPCLTRILHCITCINNGICS